MKMIKRFIVLLLCAFPAVAMAGAESGYMHDSMQMSNPHAMRGTLDVRFDPSFSGRMDSMQRINLTIEQQPTAAGGHADMGRTAMPVDSALRGTLDTGFNPYVRH